MLNEVKPSENIWVIPLQEESITCHNYEATVFGWGATQVSASGDPDENYPYVLMKLTHASIYTGKPDSSWNKDPIIHATSGKGLPFLGIVSTVG